MLLSETDGERVWVTRLAVARVCTVYALASRSNLHTVVIFYL